MKRKAVLAFIVLALIFLAQAVIAEEEKPGEEPKKFYIGLGFSYAMPKMGTVPGGDNYVPAVPFSIYETGNDLSTLDSTRGYNFKLGFAQSKNLFLEADINDLENFYWQSLLNFTGTLFILWHNKVDILTMTASAKYMLPWHLAKISPFITAGGGAMYYSIDQYANIAGAVSENYEHDFQPCMKIGAGIEYPLYETIAIAADVSYVKAFFSLSHVNYYNIGADILFHF